MSKINKVNTFMVFMFIVGLIIVITSFIGYGQIIDSCSTPSLKNSLRVCIIVGSILMTLTGGYYYCYKYCKCDYGEVSEYKLYGVLAVIMLLGISLIIFGSGIQNNISDGCTNTLKNIPTVYFILGGIIAGFSLIAILVIVKRGPPKSPPKPEETKEGAHARYVVAERTRKESLLKRLSASEAEVANAKLNIENVVSKNKKPTDDLQVKLVAAETARDLLKKEISLIKV